LLFQPSTIPGTPSPRRDNAVHYFCNNRTAKEEQHRCRRFHRKTRGHENECENPPEIQRAFCTTCVLQFDSRFHILGFGEPEVFKHWFLWWPAFRLLSIVASPPAKTLLTGTVVLETPISPLPAAFWTRPVWWLHFGLPHVIATVRNRDTSALHRKSTTPSGVSALRK
jgi:hypothetical protein